jgi:hypothetical protein
VRPADTSPEAWKLFIELQRQMSPEQKFREILDYSAFIVRLQEAGICSDDQTLTDRQAFLIAAMRRLGSSTIVEAYRLKPTTRSDVA